MKNRGWLIAAFAVLLGGCSGLQSPQNNVSTVDLEPVVIRVSGYGTYDKLSDRQDPRKHLLAMRASKLDAYRALAERVYGTVIYGSSTVNDFVLHNDVFRAYVDSYIRGAKVISVNEHADGVVETVMQLKLEPRFRACVAHLTPEEVAANCPIPMPRGNDASGDVASGKKGVDSLYYLDQ